MLDIWLSLLAQTPPQPPAASPSPQIIVRPQTVRSLPGQLDPTLVFNSNSPEVVQREGILLSTFPPAGKASPQAHLNLPLQGRFDVFAHHIAKPDPPDDLRTLYLGVLVQNPGLQPVTLDVIHAASYLSRPDAPFIEMPAFQANDLGNIYAGPGSRVASDVLRGRRQEGFPAQIVIPPGESRMLLNLPIPVRIWEPPLNGRSSLVRLHSSGPVYVASLGMFAKPAANGEERAPTLTEWQNLLQNGSLSGPRDRAPTPPERTAGIIYGRVAGVVRGSRWVAQVTDSPNSTVLTIPAAGQSISYGISTLAGGRMGTEQIQTAPLLVRYPDTAYASHGNYGIEYNLTMPLLNPYERPQTIVLRFQNPIKEDRLQGGLRFFEPLPRAVFFRGTVRVRYTDDLGLPQTRYFHIVHRRGQVGEPLATFTMPPQSRRLVQFDLIYPADATPPQIFTIENQSQ